MQCGLSSGDLPVSFSWKLNGKPANHIEGINIVNVGKKTTVLTIDSLTESHAGNYTCFAENKAGVASYSAELVVKGIYELISCMLLLFFPVPPQIIPFEFLDDPINSGDMSSLTCTVSKGDFPINISWTLNGKEVGVFGGISTFRTNQRISQLSLDSASEEHSGNYTCVAKNAAGVATHTASLHVNGRILF